MAGSGKQSHLGIAKEVIWGEAVAATDHLKYSSEKLIFDPEELVASSIPSLRDEPDSYEGLNNIGGPSVHEVHPDGLGYILRSWFGKCLTTNPTGTVFKHVFTPGLDKEASGTANSGTSTTLIDAALVATDDMYNGCWLHIISGTNSGEWRIITDSVASSNQLTVAPAFTAAINNTSVFEIRNGPKDCILPPYTLEAHRDLAKAFQFKGCVPNTLSFAISTVAKILMLTADWIAKDVALVDPTSPDPEDTEPFRWNQAILLIGRDYSSTVDIDGNTNTTTKIYDVAASYTIDALIGKYIRMTSGTCIDQIRKITDNTATTITFSPAMSAAPSNADTYEVWTEDGTMETLALAISNGLLAVPLLNNSKCIAKIVGDVFRLGTIAATFHVENRTNWETYFKDWTTRPWFLLFRGASRTSTAFYYELQFHLPKVLFTAYPLGTDGPGQLTVGATGKVKYDSTSEYLAKCVLFNAKSSY